MKRRLHNYGSKEQHNNKKNERSEEGISSPNCGGVMFT